MKVQVFVRNAAAVEAVSTKGKAYKTQTCGVMLAGSDFPVGTRMFVDQPYPVGQYEANAELTNERGDLKLLVDFRSMRPVQTPVAQPQK